MEARLLQQNHPHSLMIVFPGMGDLSRAYRFLQADNDPGGEAPCSALASRASKSES